MRIKFVYLFFLAFTFCHFVIAQSYRNNSQGEDNISSSSSYCYQRYTVEKEPFSFTERWRVKKDGVSVGSIEKEPFSITDTWKIKDSTGKTVGSMEKEAVSIGNEYAIKNPYGIRIGKMEEMLGDWQINLNCGEKLNFNELPLNQWEIKGKSTRVKIEQEPLGSSYKVKSEGMCDRNRSLLEQQLPAIGSVPILDKSNENRKEKPEWNDEPIYKPRNYLNPSLNTIQNNWKLPSFEERNKNLTKIPDPFENLNKYNSNSPNLFEPSWKRDRSIGSFDGYNQINSFENIRPLGTSSLFDEE